MEHNKIILVHDKIENYTMSVTQEMAKYETVTDTYIGIVRVDTQKR